MIVADQLTKVYENGVVGLDHLCLEVKPGEIFCMLGANGAGKTTTINLFLNFIEPTSGRALINGIDVNKDPLEAKKYVAYLGEVVQLYGNFTAIQNLDFFTKLSGRRDVSKREYRDCLRRVGLPEWAFDTKVKKFSKGMRQRVGLAIVMMKDTPAIILDEPTSGLDPRGAQDFLDMLKVLRDEGKAIFMSTHAIFRAKEVGDRVGIMKQGRLVMVLEGEELEEVDLEKVYLEYMRGWGVD
mgnify:CR=1 FL=1